MPGISCWKQNHGAMPSHRACSIVGSIIKPEPAGSGTKVVQAATTTGEVTTTISTRHTGSTPSPWLESPGLIEIKAVTVDKQLQNEFSLNVNLTREKPPEAVAAPAGKKAPKG